MREVYKPAPGAAWGGCAFTVSRTTNQPTSGAGGAYSRCHPAGGQAPNTTTPGIPNTRWHRLEAMDSSNRGDCGCTRHSAGRYASLESLPTKPEQRITTPGEHTTNSFTQSTDHADL